MFRYSSILSLSLALSHLSNTGLESSLRFLRSLCTQFVCTMLSIGTSRKDAMALFLMIQINSNRFGSISTKGASQARERAREREREREPVLYSYIASSSCEEALSNEDKTCCSSLASSCSRCESEEPSTRVLQMRVPHEAPTRVAHPRATRKRRRTPRCEAAEAKRAVTWWRSRATVGGTLRARRAALAAPRTLPVLAPQWRHRASRSRSVRCSSNSSCWSLQQALPCPRQVPARDAALRCCERRLSRCQRPLVVLAHPVSRLHWVLCPCIAVPHRSISS